MLTVHGAPGNLSPIKHRRVLSTRWLGTEYTDCLLLCYTHSRISNLIAYLILFIEQNMHALVVELIRFTLFLKNALKIKEKYT